MLSMTHVFGAEEAGVKIMTRCQVLAVVKDDVWRVETTQGLMRAVCVINCAGNFGDELEKMRGKVRTKVNFQPVQLLYILRHSTLPSDLVRGSILCLMIQFNTQ